MNSSVSLTDLLNNNNFIVRPTVGVSMEPLLHENTTLVVIVKDYPKLKKGDIVLYQRANGNFVLHRIIRCGEEFLFIRGDNCYYLEKVYKSQIKGGVVQVYRNGKFFSVDKSFFYKIYKFYILYSYPFRSAFYKLKNKSRGALRRVKHFLRRFTNEK